MSLRAVQTEYGALAGQYDQRWARYVASSTALADARVVLRAGMRVLDVGCGTGVLLDQLRQREASLRLLGIDATPGMLARARHRMGPHAMLVEGSGDALPLADQSVDTVVSTSALHYIADMDRALGEMARVLVPGGQLVVVDWCADYLTMRALDLLLRVVDRAHERTASTARLRASAVGAKLVDVQVTAARIDRFWGLMVLTARTPI